MKLILEQNTSIEYWASWAEDLLLAFQDDWLDRDGPDITYHSKVILPPIIEYIKSNRKEYKAIIDLGCGDGCFTEMMNSSLKNIDNDQAEIILVEMLLKKLNVAEKILSNYNKKSYKQNLIDRKWHFNLTNSASPRLFLCIFLIEELPNVSNLFRNLSLNIQKKDTLILVSTLPKYSEELLKNNIITQEANVTDNNNDWVWCAKYPLPTSFNQQISIPYFHRFLKDIEKILMKNDFKIVHYQELNVEKLKKKNKDEFIPIYGSSFINNDTSYFMVITKC